MAREKFLRKKEKSLREVFGASAGRRGKSASSVVTAEKGFWPETRHSPDALPTAASGRDTTPNQTGCRRACASLPLRGTAEGRGGFHVTSGIQTSCAEGSRLPRRLWLLQ